jgi:Splicing factor 3B subunit 10 (SF3b10)
VTSQHREQLASMVGHADELLLLATAEGESVGRVRYEMIERMLQPCGPPPPRLDQGADGAEGLEDEEEEAARGKGDGEGEEEEGEGEEGERRE